MGEPLPVRVRVDLSCGHGWTEIRPAGMNPPVDGELRACGDPDHYPAQYTATYSEPGDGGATAAGPPPAGTPCT
jgi:hypothetical protein